MPSGKKTPESTRKKIFDLADKGVKTAEISRITGVNVCTINRMRREERAKKPVMYDKQMDPDLKAQWDYMHERYGRKRNDTPDR